MTHKIDVLPGGDVTVDGERFAKDKVVGLVGGLADRGQLDDYILTEAKPSSVEGWCALLQACRKAGDGQGADGAFDGLCEAMMVEAGMAPSVEAPEGKVPTTKNMTAALQAGASVVAGWPLESHNGRRDPAEVRAQASQLERQDRLLSLFVRCGALARRNVGHAAQASEGWLQKLRGAVAEAEPGNPRLQAAMAPVHAYFVLPIDRGLDTKRTAARVWDEAARETEAAVLESARGEARAELKEKVGAQFADLIGP